MRMKPMQFRMMKLESMYHLNNGSCSLKYSEYHLEFLNSSNKLFM